MPLNGIKLLVCDYDNALYHTTPEYTRAITLIYAEVLVNHGIASTLVEAENLAVNAYKKHGHSVFGFVDYGLCPENFFHTVHDAIIERRLKQKHLVGRGFDLSPLKKHAVKCVMLTHGSKPYALHGRDVFEYESIFLEEDVHGLDTLGVSPNNLKSNREPWVYICKHYGVKPEEIAVLEDSAGNLCIPHDMKMRTIFVENDQGFHYNSHALEGEHLHHPFKTTADFLKSL